MNVLIIDDDRAILLLVKAFFEEAGHDTTTANCGKRALELFEKQNFDLIVTDVVMPDLDGFQVIERIREISNSFIPVIFMTSSKEDDELQKGIDAGGGIYLPKPLKPILLESYIKVMESLVSMRDELTYKAKFDNLTGLPNRTLLYDRLNSSIKRAKRSKTKIVLLFIDLDHFKDVNDLMGHDAGDAVLKETANRLQECVRDSDTVSRIGGDEFVIMLPDINTAYSIDKVIMKILEKLNKPFKWGNKETPFVSGSIGVSVYPDDATDIEGLLKTSDIAMYKAKKDGRNNCSHFNQELGDAVHKRTLLENELRHAIERQQLELYYQPQLTCDTYQLSGMEVLLRWNHPEYGMISPEEFIPIAEDSGLISSLGMWVLKNTCKQIKLWDNSGYIFPRVSVNLSVRQFKDENLENSIIKMIENEKISSNSLALEITESCVMDDPEKTIEILSRLREHGLKISMDDFGTGYSSMSYLKKLPIDQLKIDREFIKLIPDAENDCAIASATIALGHSLGLNVIAEGVETSEQFRFLKKEGCDEIQGYLFGKPKTTKDTSFMLESSETGRVINKPLLMTA